MGAWGPGVFENDAALDWVAEAVEADALHPLLEQLLEAVDGTVELEVDEASVALALGELVATALGRPGERLPADLSRWLEGADAEVPRGQLKRLLPVVAHAADPARSELATLWFEAGNGAEFLAVVEPLVARLRALAADPRPLDEA
jgi:hypothetical protein